MRSTKRNLGVELLRLVSMMMIVILHCVGHGGLMNGFIFPKNIIFTVLQTFSMGAVNLYAITTGYACIKSTHRWHRGILLWLQVAFYTISISAISLLFDYNAWSKTLLGSVFPVTINMYWYVSAYFMLFCAIPFINKLLLSITKRQFRKILVIGFVALCIFVWISDNFGLMPSFANDGYSPVWLAYLYFVGAYFRLYSEDFAARPKRVYMGIYIACSLVALLSRYAIGLVTQRVLGRVAMEKILCSYMSPLILIGAAALFLFFANLEIKKGRFIALIAPCSFGVYLFHEHPILRVVLVKGGLGGCLQMTWYQAFGCMVLFAVAVFSAGIAIDLLRRRLFALLHVEQFALWLEEKAKGFGRKLIR